MSRAEGVIRVRIEAPYPSLRVGLAAMLADDALLSVAPLDEPDAPADLLVVHLTGDTLGDIEAGIPLVLLGGDPAIDGSSLRTEAVAWLPADASARVLLAAIHAVAAGLTVIDPALVEPGRGAVIAALAPSAAYPASTEALTPREREVLALVANGLPNKGIAHQLGISEHTAKFHVASLLAKLDAGSRTEAVTNATRRGLLAL